MLRWIERYFTSISSSPLMSSKSNTAETSSSSSSRKAESTIRPGGPSLSDVLRGASPVVCTEHMPIILQHAGHSRTVVGFEKCKDGKVNLLVFDPS